ncbi:SDR family NAD(P)-dependent oxidoreductase [Terribacillus saccharophilus]|uniref:SDR family NAD(P)-dependent oxidoreductase n=1 Tax=Terribacillus saccharophilus TaxID=361277 RepID=UPI0039824842
MQKIKRFEGKVAVVTGGASGIGYAIVKQLVDEGARVGVADINEESLKEMTSLFKDSIMTSVTDVTDEQEIKAFIKATYDTFGSLDYAFNVAGASKSAPIEQMTEENWDFTVDLCLKSVFFSMKHEIEFLKNRGGAIVNIASLNAQIPSYGGGAYSSAKAGVEILSKTAALETAKYNIRVNAILPGLITTALTEGVSHSKLLDAYLEKIPMDRAGEPAEIAAPALFLVSNEASYINGASLVIDGAWSTTGNPDMSSYF